MALPPAVCNAYRAAYQGAPDDLKPGLWKQLTEGGCDVSGLEPPSDAQPGATPAGE